MALEVRRDGGLLPRLSLHLEPRRTIRRARRLVTLPVHRRELKVHPLTQDRIVAVCRQDHPLARYPTVPVADLAGLGLVGFEAGSAIRQIIDAALRDAGVEMNVVMELRSIPAIVRMVAITGNLAFVSRMGVEQESDVHVLRVHGLDIRRQLAVIARRGALLSPAARAFAAHLPGKGDVLPFSET